LADAIAASTATCNRSPVPPVWQRISRWAIEDGNSGRMRRSIHDRRAPVKAGSAGRMPNRASPADASIEFDARSTSSRSRVALHRDAGNVTPAGQTQVPTPSKLGEFLQNETCSFDGLADVAQRAHPSGLRVRRLSQGRVRMPP